MREESGKGPDKEDGGQAEFRKGNEVPIVRLDQAVQWNQRRPLLSCCDIGFSYCLID